jgi:hypothetical protein
VNDFENVQIYLQIVALAEGEKPLPLFEDYGDQYHEIHLIE